ncbi:MAG: hypothetical protein ACKOX6_14805 [Bdellovibrio sp.]
MFKAITTMVLMSSFFVGTLAQAFDDQGTLKAAVLAQFLKDANNPRSVIGKQITQINQETGDGRNQEGTIEMPIKKEHVQIVMIAVEENHAPWHYANKDKGYCRATGDSATYAIYLSQAEDYHYGRSFSTVIFVGEAKEYMRARILVKDSEEIYCEELGPVSEDDPTVKKTFGKIETTIKVSKIKLVTFPEVDLE